MSIIKIFPNSTLNNDLFSHIHIYVPTSEISELCWRWNVKELHLFGSVLRDDFKPDSDVDVLVSFDDNIKRVPEDLMKMRVEFEIILGRKVDLVDETYLINPYLRHSILYSKAKPLTGEDRDPVYLWEMLYAARKMHERIVGIKWDQFEKGESLMSVVEFNIGIIAIMAAGISEESRLAHPEIPWETLITIQNKLSDEYIKVHPTTFKDMRLIWDFLANLPILIRNLMNIIPPIPSRYQIDYYLGSAESHEYPDL